MNLPTRVVITGCDSLPILQQALQAARSFQPMNSSQVAMLLEKTAKAAEAGQFELYKTSHRFDGTYANPQWLGQKYNEFQISREITTNYAGIHQHRWYKSR